jgi:hypothetical protein
MDNPSKYLANKTNGNRKQSKCLCQAKKCLYHSKTKSHIQSISNMKHADHRFIEARTLIPFSIPAVKTSDVRTKSSNMFKKDILAMLFTFYFKYVKSKLKFLTKISSTSSLASVCCSLFPPNLLLNIS